MPSELSITPKGNDPSCFDKEDGWIQVFADGGFLRYQYTWEDGPKDSTIVDIGQGVYQVLVSDANGCQVLSSDTLNFIDRLAYGITLQDLICDKTNSGMISIDILNRLIPNFYINGNIPQNDISFNNLTADVYSIEYNHSEN